MMMMTMMTTSDDDNDGKQAPSRVKKSKKVVDIGPAGTVDINILEKLLG